MADKTLKVTKINGSIIIESTEGHLVELDKLNRVVMVRVHKHEAEIAKNRSGNSSYESLYSFSANENGSQCMHLPAGITVTQNQQAVVVKLPDGAIFENAFQQAV